jgi:hypothetical protein
MLVILAAAPEQLSSNQFINAAQFRDIQTAINRARAGDTIYVPPGTFPTVAGLNINKRLTIIFDDAAGTRLLRAPILITSPNVRLFGSRVYTNESGGLVAGTGPGATFKWDGGDVNTAMIQVHRGTEFPESLEFVGIHIAGIALDGGLVGRTGQQITGIEIGQTGNSAGNSFSLYENITIQNVFQGLVLSYVGNGQNHYRKIIVRNNMNEFAITPSSIGIRIQHAGAQYFRDMTVEGFETLIKLGDNDTQPTSISFTESILEDFTATAVEIARALDVTFERNHFEGINPGETAKRFFKIGTGEGALSIVIRANFLAGLIVGGAHLEGFNFLGLVITENYFGAGAGPHTIFKNNPEGRLKAGGKYYNNNVDAAAATLTDVDDPRGFELIHVTSPEPPTPRSGHDPHNNRSRYDAKRWAASLGSKLTTRTAEENPPVHDCGKVQVPCAAGNSFGNFCLSGWGVGAQVLSVAGTDARGRFTIISGANPEPSPTVTLTFEDGTWGNPPFAIVSRNDGQEPHVLPTWTTTETTLCIEFVDIPEADQQYTFEFMVMG